MIEDLLALPGHLRRRLAEAVDAGLLVPPYPPAALAALAGAGAAAARVRGALLELDGMGLSGRALASWMRSLETLADRSPRPDLVWSGPSVPGLHARETRRVFEELLGGARESLWISSFVFFDGPRAFRSVADRMEALPELEVTLLLNIQRRRGDATPAGSLVRQFADRFWGGDWPGKRRPRVFYDPRSLELDGPEGVLHAKAVVADLDVVFVTSANLTEAALDRNIELGLLLRDPALAKSIVSHLQRLIEERRLDLLPD